MSDIEPTEASQPIDTMSKAPSSPRLSLIALAMMVGAGLGGSAGPSIARTHRQRLPQTKKSGRAKRLAKKAERAAAKAVR